MISKRWPRSHRCLYFCTENSSHAERQNFLDEFKSMTKIRRHPNIVKIIGACQHEGKSLCNGIRHFNNIQMFHPLIIIH